MNEHVPAVTAAKRLGVQPHTLAVWRMKGVGPRYVRLGGPSGRVVYKLADLDAYLEVRTFKSTTEEAAAAASAAG